MGRLGLILLSACLGCGPKRFSPCVPPLPGEGQTVPSPGLFSPKPEMPKLFPVPTTPPPQSPVIIVLIGG